MLPSVGFKGFLDISVVTQKMRKHMHSQDGHGSPTNFDFASPKVGPGTRRANSKMRPIKASMDLSAAAAAAQDGPATEKRPANKGTRF